MKNLITEIVIVDGALLLLSEDNKTKCTEIDEYMHDYKFYEACLFAKYYTIKLNLSYAKMISFESELMNLELDFKAKIESLQNYYQNSVIVLPFQDENQLKFNYLNKKIPLLNALVKTCNQVIYYYASLKPYYDEIYYVQTEKSTINREFSKFYFEYGIIQNSFIGYRNSCQKEVEWYIKHE